MAEVRYQPISRLLPVILLSCIWGTFTVFWLLWDTIRLGPRQVFGRRKWTKRPSVLDDPKLGTHHYARLKNIRLHYVAKGPKDRPLVLFIHGFPELWYSWRHQLKEFGTNYRAVALDLRGYGDSEKPENVKDYHMSVLIDDVKNFIDHLGYRKCYLVAHDGGAIFCWLLAAKYPDIIEKLVIMNAPHPYTYVKLASNSLRQLVKAWYVFLFQVPYLAELKYRSNNYNLVDKFLAPAVAHPESFTSEDLDVYKYTMRNTSDITALMNYYRSYVCLAPERLPNVMIQAPTMVIWGCQDLALSREFPKLAKKYVSNEYTVHYLEHANHWVQQEQPALVNKYIREFLA